MHGPRVEPTNRSVLPAACALPWAGCLSVPPFRAKPKNLVLRPACAIFGVALDRLRLGSAQINLALRSPCTIFGPALDRLRLGKMQVNLLLRSACTIFAL